MKNRPCLSKGLDSETFKKFYYLKKELVDFCKDNFMSSAGSKADLNNRIIHFLNTGERLTFINIKKSKIDKKNLSLNTIVEENFCYSECKREFFKSIIGSKFTFCVPLQRFIKANVGKKYSDIVDEWYRIQDNKKRNKGNSVIDSQFEYNTYIRDFFKENKGKSLKDAIKCWKYKKSIEGSNRYEEEDLEVLFR